ncbi:MAG TPA: hypothetical protein VNI02_14520 [Blastocatellia bacterium]|nr:hypothetical protein [Blastocatellia bacterium]
MTVPPKAIDWLKINLKSYTKASIVELGKAWLRASERLGFDLPFTTSEPGKAGSCYMWLYRWVKDISGPAMTLLTEGERGLEAKYGYIIRDYSDLKPRDGFVMDWRLHDVECWQPARKAGGKPLLTRLWLCPVLDLASCAVFGFELANRPSTRGVTRAYLNAIADGRWAYWKNEPGLDLLCGMQITRDEQRPAFAYWDNGKDYRAYAVEGKEVVITHFDLESGLAAVLATYKVGLAAEVNITVRHAKKYNAKAKPIEPWHHYAIAPWEKTIPGYKGSKPSDRPSWYQAARRLHDDFMRRREGKLSDLRVLPPSWKEVFERNKATYGFGTPFFSEAEFRAELLKCILDYLHRPHGRLTDDVGEVSPIEYINRYADSPQKLSDLSMAGLLMEPRILKLRRGELSVQFRGERFVYREVASELSDGSALLRVPDRTDVEFRYDPEGLGRGLVISGGAPLCWVEQPELLSWNATAEAFEAAYDQKKKAKKVAKEFFETRSRPPQWRDNVQSPTDLPVGNVLPFTRAVGTEPELSGSAQLGMGAGDDAAVITSATRYDRRHQVLPTAPPLPKNSTDDQGRDEAEQRPWVDPWETISQGDDPEEEDLIEPWE